ncbi:restriction endonuclease [Campylobacter fetus subsp. testudinum]|uniref:Restriction endonuclease n=1 Tax=Campylobacter fetus subsp. testudinum TaxID=1507806 RepID=A0AAX0HCS4_CAMFE|nr:AlwI family type II restriction endonuclease [Campylobacter fetus]OCR91423.1 restriction endonuclease [Campylobacter fetus subsp. testudinum]
MHNADQKILSFSTTMRNPARMGYFLVALMEFENQTLTHEIIMQIVKRVLDFRLYKPTSLKNKQELNVKFSDKNYKFNNTELEKIIKISPQNHKERGFDKGWESRFDTWYKLMSEFGFCYYAKDKPLLISDTGKMLIKSCYDLDAKIFKESVDEGLLSSVFLNALSRYEVGNPYKKNLNHNTPFRLLLHLLNKLHQNQQTCLSIKEIPILLCWHDNNVDALYEFITALRDKIYELNRVKFSYSDEFIYKKCLKLLQSDNQKRFKMSQITGEAVDEYVRKMRITGLISLRGAGRFIDINRLEAQKVKHILSLNSSFKGNYLDDSDKNRLTFYQYMSQIDSILITQSKKVSDKGIKLIKLREFANSYTINQIQNELKIVCSKSSSNDELLKYIDKPLRFEFLAAIYLCQNFNNLQVLPNYKCDDEGVPTFTASGGVADILAYDKETESYVEVSLIRDRTQTTNEIMPIARHLRENINKSNNNKAKFSLFVAPIIHDDVKRYTRLIKLDESLDIAYYNIDEFVSKVQDSLKIAELNEIVLDR